MFLVALTGGIAAGKSTVAAEFARLGGRVIDADAVSRDVVMPGTPALEEVRRVFGEEVIATDGSLNRAHLGSIVFADPERLRQLNAIVHPAVRERVRGLLDDIQRDEPDAVVIYDVPLLIEAQVDHPWDLVIVVLADEATRVQRLVEHRGLDEEHARMRIQRQATDEQRVAAADVVIDANTSVAETLRQTRDVWERIQRDRVKRA